MVKSTLNEFELNERANEVFELYTGDYVYSVTVQDDGRVQVLMDEAAEGSSTKKVLFNYEPDMTDRPQALDYLLGRRDDFND